MARTDSRQQEFRSNKVFKAMNRPLTILGAERRLFFVALISGSDLLAHAFPARRRPAVCRRGHRGKASDEVRRRDPASAAEFVEIPPTL